MELSQNEIRIVGCLMEKAVTTPDQCPLTLNALRAACNQKSSRDPVLALDPATVQRTARALEEQGFVTSEENFRTGIVKYSQRFCNTAFSDQQFTEAGYAIICLLLLRGPQTPGELRTRSARLFAFEDNDAVDETLAGLMDTAREGGAVVARLPRKPGRRDHEYVHLFSGHVDSVPLERPATGSPTGATARRESAFAALEARVAALEHDIAELKRQGP